MKQPSKGIVIYGWIEVATFLAILTTISDAGTSPFFLILYAPPIIILGVFTLKLKPFARSINLLLSPFVALVYNSAFFALIDHATSFIKLPFDLTRAHFYISWLALTVIHIVFFLNPNVKAQFIKQ